MLLFEVLELDWIRLFLVLEVESSSHPSPVRRRLPHPVAIFQSQPGVWSCL